MKKELLKPGIMLKTKKNINVYDKNIILERGFCQYSKSLILKHQNVFIVSNKYICDIFITVHDCWDVIIIKEGESSLKQLRLNNEDIKNVFEIILS